MAEWEYNRLDRYADRQTLQRSADAFAAVCPLTVGLYDLWGQSVWLPEDAENASLFPKSLRDDEGLSRTFEWIKKHMESCDVSENGHIEYILAPVESRGICIGLLLAIPDPENKVIGDPGSYVSILHFYGCLLAEVIESDKSSALMLDELGKQYEELAAVCSMMETLDLSKDFEDALNTVAGSMSASLNVDLVVLSVPNQDFYWASAGQAATEVQLSELSHTLLQRIDEAQDSFAMNNLHSDDEIASEASDYAHVAATPLEVDGDPGVLAFLRVRVEDQIDTSDLRVLETIAREVSILLANKKIHEEQNQLYESSIFSLANLAELRDDDSGQHLKRIEKYCFILANHLEDTNEYRNEIDKRFVEQVSKASALHDIGKVRIPDAILLKPERLTLEEYAIMKKHTVIGGDTIRDIEMESACQGHPFLVLSRQIAYSHHERWDGEGYPHGLRGQDIPLAARITSIADVYDALTTKRCYKPAFPHKKAVEILRRGSGSQFDPILVDTFLTVSEEFNKIRMQYGGSEVRQDTLATLF